MTRRDYPILEFDPTRQAVIEPSRIIKPEDVPERVVLCFFKELKELLAKYGDAKVASNRKSEMGLHPLYEIEVDGRRLGAMQPGIGAPFAGALLDELIALGCRKFIVCGSCGVLESRVAAGQAIIPTSAVRDEGMSYHYLPPGREARPSAEGVAAIESVLKEHSVDYITGKTWTTDAFYRETPDKVKARRDEGCLTVEMEAAALFAIAEFRGVTLAQLLCGGDDLGGDEWDARDYFRPSGTREKLFRLAVEACLKL